MSMILSLTQSQALAALRSVLLTILPTGIEIIQSEDNLVPEPFGLDFVIFTPILRNRLSFNQYNYQDCAFTGSVSGTSLTVSSVLLGSINTQAQPSLFGPNVLVGTVITGQTSGTVGGAGVYTVSQAQSIASEPLAAGVLGMTQPTQITVQCDVHGPASGDNVQLISTVIHSTYGVGLFQATGYDVTPLYCGDPRQTPFFNKEDMVEKMWNCDVVLQANQIVFSPQQFFAAFKVGVQPPVDARP